MYLAPLNKFNFTERRRLLLDKRLDVIEYDPRNNHIEVDNFIDILLKTVTKTEEEKQQLLPQKDSRNIHVQIFSSMNGKNEKSYGSIVGDFIDSLDSFNVDFLANFDYFFDPKYDVKNLNEDLYEDLNEKPTISIIIISAKELKSNKFEKEIELTILRQLEKSNRIIPLVIGQIEIPYILRNYHYIQLNENFTIHDLEPLRKLIN